MSGPAVPAWHQDADFTRIGPAGHLGLHYRRRHPIGPAGSPGRPFTGSLYERSGACPAAGVFARSDPRGRVVEAVIRLSDRARAALRPGEVLVFDWHRVAMCCAAAGDVSLHPVPRARLGRPDLPAGGLRPARRGPRARASAPAPLRPGRDRRLRHAPRPAELPLRPAHGLRAAGQPRPAARIPLTRRRHGNDGVPAPPVQPRRTDPRFGRHLGCRGARRRGRAGRCWP